MSSFGEHGDPAQNMARQSGKLRRASAGAVNSAGKGRPQYARMGAEAEPMTGRPAVRTQQESTTVSDSEDQRIQPRFLAPCLNVSMRCRGWFGWQKEALPVECVDINRYGTALITRRDLRPGSRILLDFKGKYITQSDVSATVVSQSQLDDGSYRLGIQFVYCIDGRNYSRAIDNALSQIEAFCRRRMARYRN